MKKYSDYSHHDSPDKATEFSGNTGNGDMAMFALIEEDKCLVKTGLSFECIGDDARLK